jgi:hypothetical protein
MLLILRNLKQSYFANAEFRKYLLYAIGEMGLVIIGILIALQIDNWNANRLEQEALKGYLNTISRNIGSDLASIDELRSERLRAYELSVRWISFQPRSRPYRVHEVALASQVISEASTLRHFNASSSGYEALKNSGTLDEMQGTDIEALLFDYYDTVARLARSEQDHNELNRALLLQVLAHWPGSIEPWEISSVSVLTADRFKSSQSVYRELLRDNTMQQFLSRPSLTGTLLRDYDKLDRLGRAFRHLVNIDSVTLDDTATRIMDDIHDPRSGIGQPNVIVDGQAYWHSYNLIASDANDPRVSNEASAAGLDIPFDPDSFQRVGDSLHISYYGGAAWAGQWFAAGANAADRDSPDYSMYSKLILELKGDRGGEKIIVNLEDRDDPADGSSTRYELQLSDEWQTYEIDLSEFKTADLRILSIPLGFVFLEEPVSFSVRTARFVKAD